MAYVKHNFSTGDTLYASQLNEMDTQILANETAATNAKSVANTAKTTADSAKSAADAAKTTADNALPLTGGVINGTLAVNGGIFSSADIIDDGQLVTKKYVDSVAQNGASTIEPAEDDMPKVFIDGTIPTTKDDVLAELTYISKSETFHAYMKIKGQGSYSMSCPKKNFTVKLYSDEARETDLPKLFKDWGVESSKFVLKANYIDHSHARNIVCARLWDEVVSSRPDYDTLPAEMRNSPRNGAIDGFPIKVYTNGTYQGVYTWNIGKDAWMWGMDEDNPNHVLLCGEKNTDGVYAETACNFRALWSGTDEDNWSVEVGTNSDAVKNSLNALISCVKDTDDETFKSTIGTYLDVQSAIDYYIHQYVICGIDGLAKNMLLATYDGVKWICGAYDMDAVLGSDIMGSVGAVTDWPSYNNRCPEDYQEMYSLLWERIEALFADELKARYAELRKSVYTFSNMFTHFERFMDTIGLDLYAEDLTIYSKIPSGDTNNIKQIRTFIMKRLGYTDYEILNIEQEEPQEYLYVLPEATTFDGATYIDTGVKLFDTPKDFTLFVDFTIPSGTTLVNDATLLEAKDPYDSKISIDIQNQGGYFAVNTSGGRNPTAEETDGSWGHTFATTDMIVCVFKAGVFQFGKYHKTTDSSIRDITAHSNNTYIQHTSNLGLGGYVSWDGENVENYWAGTVHDLRVYNRAMTEDEVVTLINSANA